MGIKENIRQIALENHIDYFGVAPVSRWANAPKDHKPNDFLADAKTVIVMGKKIPEGAIESNNLAYNGGYRDGIFSYMIFGYNKINDVLNNTLYKIALYIEEKMGEKAFIIPASTPRDEYEMMGVMSNRHAAVLAGIATFGWNGLALTADAGPRVRYCQMITNIELDPQEYNQMLEPDSICDRSKCRVCIDVCPVKAFPETDAHEFYVDDKLIRYAKLNRPRCRTGVTGLAAGTAGRLNAIIPEGINKVEDWLDIAKNDDKWNRMERVASMCGRCMITCPVGRTKTDNK